MTTSEERMRILRMIQDGKITAEEGAHLIQVMDVKKPSLGSHPISSKVSRWFRVQVTDTNTGKTRVNLRLPVSLIQAGQKMGARFSPEVQGLDMEVLTRFIDSGEIGKVIDVTDTKDGEHIEVFIE
jgi:hypothetical protein